MPPSSELAPGANAQTQVLAGFEHGISGSIKDVFTLTACRLWGLVFDCCFVRGLGLGVQGVGFY